jgi:hypothetical protein
MNKSYRPFAAAALLIIAASLAGAAFAADTARPAAPAATRRRLPLPLQRGKSPRSRPSRWRSRRTRATVTKAYQDTKKGKKTWEVKINGTDGKKWEVHYEIKTGALVSEEGK